MVQPSFRGDLTDVRRVEKDRASLTDHETEASGDSVGASVDDVGPI